MGRAPNSRSSSSVRGANLSSPAPSIPLIRYLIKFGTAHLTANSNIEAEYLIIPPIRGIIWKRSDVMDPICAVYTKDGVIVVPDLSDANTLYQDGYGSPQDDYTLELKPFEALYLLERSRIIVLDEKDRRRLSFEELLRRFSSEDQLSWTRYLVYRDLRARGFVVRGGEGRAIDFLVYERGSYPKRPPRYMIHAICEGSPEPISHILEILEAAEEENKILKIAVIDRRGEVVYYTIAEMKFQEEDEKDLR